ncbi:hypothetical protein E2562_017467 [Oryza meyeriana var. granulata]|uniref:Uncharacterized protein n=1 Tax=Oryza meyeriana var. granulata TaxID=110450 RepID=A0A6G1DY03_9ORYZ|nr:hypothetical protein E2562_017467 [Oryza meyeriana var. granulata]
MGPAGDVSCQTCPPQAWRHSTTAKHHKPLEGRCNDDDAEAWSHTVFTSSAKSRSHGETGESS